MPSMVPNAAVRSSKRGRRCYFEHGLTHHAHGVVILLAGLMAVATISWMLPLLFMTAAHTLLVVVLPQCGWFRRGVDEGLDQSERAKAVEVRAAVLGRISVEHRRELAALEALAAEESASEPAKRGVARASAPRSGSASIACSVPTCSWRLRRARARTCPVCSTAASWNGT